LKALVKANDREELEKRLAQRIAFGTAGLRAKMEAGFSRMNDLTVLQTSQGLAAYVKNSVPEAELRGVVIGHDHRHNSARFAELTALAFVRKGFKVYQLGLVHTPLVPFCVDEEKAACGVMITASHNPAQDNGYKVYWENGCQIIPPHDIGIAQSIEENLDPWTWDVSHLENNDQLVRPGSKLKSKYFAAMTAKLRAPSLGAIPRDFKIVYTPMHGVGLPFIQGAASHLDLPADAIVAVDEQAQPDPDFPTVTFPNPEERGALDMAIKTADEHAIDVVLANDPDADRFAVAVKNQQTDKWKQLTGNHIGALFANYCFHRYQREHNGDVSKLAMLNSTVSSRLMAKLARKHGFHYEDTLTGFKWIGNRAITLEYLQYTVPFAFEEALGYMFPVVHDKDGISAAYVFLQILIELQKKGTTVLDELEQIYREVGYFEEHNSYYISPDSSTTDKVFAQIRSLGGDNYPNSHPKAIGQFSVTSWRDLTVGYDSRTNDNKPILPVSATTQMVTVELKDSDGRDVRFTARGSGTEPKLKVYIEATADTELSAKTLADEMWMALEKEWFRPEETGLTRPTGN
jgi:phosphoglucomutase